MYFITKDLSETHSNGASQAALKQSPKIGGDWLYDLLDTQGATVQHDCTSPAGEDVDTLTEVCGSPVGSTFIRDVNAHLFPVEE